MAASTQPARSARRQKCFLCDLPKSSWTILNDFSQPVCRGCVNYEGLDRIEDAITDSKRLRDLEGSGLIGTTAASGSCSVTVTPSLTTCAQLDSTTLAAVDSSTLSGSSSGSGGAGGAGVSGGAGAGGGVSNAGPRFEPTTPQSADGVDFLGAADLTTMVPGSLPANSIVGSSATTAAGVSNPAAPTAARADSQSATTTAFDDFPSPLTPYSPDWGSGRAATYGGALRMMDPSGYGTYNPLATPDYLRPNPYAGYIAAHDSAFTYYGGWRAMKRSTPEETMFNPYTQPARPGSVPPRRMSEPSPSAKRMDKGNTPKSPGLTPGATQQRPFDSSADQPITIAESPVSKCKSEKSADRTPGEGSENSCKSTTGVPTPGNTSNSGNGQNESGKDNSTASMSRDKSSLLKGNSSSSPDSNANGKSDSSASNSLSGNTENSEGRTDTDANKTGLAAASTAGNTETSALGYLSPTSSSSASGNANSKHPNQPPASTPQAANADTTGAMAHKSCNHCGCGLSSVQYVQCPSVERHRYCLFCTFMHIEWSDPGAVSCPSKSRCLHPTSNVPWVFLPNEIESIRKAVQQSETPAIMQ